MPAPMESPRTLIAVRNLKENIILGSKNIYHHPQPGCKHYDDSYGYNIDDGDVCRPIKQPVHREDDGDRLTGKSNLMRVSLTLKLFNPIAFFLLGNFYMIILSCATHCVENHDHSNKPRLKGLSRLEYFFPHFMFAVPLLYLYPCLLRSFTLLLSHLLSFTWGTLSLSLFFFYILPLIFLMPFCFIFIHVLYFIFYLGHFFYFIFIAVLSFTWGIPAAPILAAVAVIEMAMI